MLKKSKKEMPTPKESQILKSSPIKRKRNKGEKDAHFMDRPIELKYEYQLSGGTLFPYGGNGNDYWAALEAFNTRREQERRQSLICEE